MPDEKLGPDGKPINTGNILSNVSEEYLQKQILEQNNTEKGETSGEGAGQQTDVDSWDKPHVDYDDYIFHQEGNKPTVTKTPEVTTTVPDDSYETGEMPTTDPDEDQSWGEWFGEKAKDVTRYAVNQGNIIKDILNKPGVRKFRSDFKSGFKGNPRGVYKEGGPVKAKGRYGGNVPGMKHGGMKK